MDLARPWAPHLVATDGAQSFGFGMAQAHCAPDLVREVAAHCAVEGHGFLPRGVDMNTDSVKAISSPLVLPCCYDDFVPQICVKAKEACDAPTLEAIAVTLATRRLTRTRRNHGHKAVMLIDTQALLYALRKGRSSSGAFKVQLQKVAALNLCADISVVYGYIPTSCNPADPPSRGVRRRISKFGRGPPSRSKLSQHFQSLRRAERHLRSSPVPGVREDMGDKGSYDSSSSDSLTVQP